MSQACRPEQVASLRGREELCVVTRGRRDLPRELGDVRVRCPGGPRLLMSEAWLRVAWSWWLVLVAGPGGWRRQGWEERLVGAQVRAPGGK